MGFDPLTALSGSDKQGTTPGPGQGQEKDAAKDADAAEVTRQLDPVDESVGSLSAASAAEDVDAAIELGRAAKDGVRQVLPITEEMIRRADDAGLHDPERWTMSDEGSPRWARSLKADQIRVVLAEPDPERRRKMEQDIEEAMASFEGPPPRRDAGGLGRRRRP